ncbi:MAG: hypothetical protein FJX75_20960 [Armatimonadetes bacterium]|nr:hypothetical protein [Armatimonadota bacterium]
MALLIQPLLRTHARGHLSNERRIAEEARNWVYEVEPQTGQAGGRWGFRLRGSGPPLRGEPLRCPSKAALAKRLKEIAQFARQADGQRSHLEWVWDGERVWVVQWDAERAERGQPPGHVWLARRGGAPPPPNLRVLRSDPYREETAWPKVECVRAFSLCGLPTPSIYLLDDPGLLTSVAKGEIPESLQHDLGQLLRRPVVVRTDAKRGQNCSRELLPRSDAHTDLAGIAEFLTRIARQMATAGLQPDGYSFILHQFIPAPAAAFSYASPASSSVLVDGIWGSPDGLLCYPHDTFAVDVANDRLTRVLRCKEEYLDADAGGKWVRRRAGRPWDWRPSLTPTQVREIGRMSHRIAQRLGIPVRVMFFVGVARDRAGSDCLPWFSEPAEGVPDVTRETLAERFRKSVVVRNYDDLDLLRQLPAAQRSLRLKLRPDEELLRDRTFLTNVGNLASERGWHISLEGSILSHGYYILQRTGAPVHCADPYTPEPKREQFGKLVRDLIPVRIERHGEVVHLARCTGPELVRLLKAKAVEEALELAASESVASEMEEMADLQEVIAALCELIDRTEDDLHELTERKRKERGAFREGYVLVETKELPLVRTQRRADAALELLHVDGTERPSQHLEVRSKIGTAPAITSRPDGIYVPLVPPVGSGTTTKVRLAQPQVEVTVRYEPKEVVVSVGPLPPTASTPPLPLADVPTSDGADRPQEGSASAEGTSGQLPPADAAKCSCP